MKFDHEEIDKNNVIEDYLLGNLSEEDESGFEEHLLNCEICRDRVLQTERVIDGLEDSTVELTYNRVSETREKSKRLRSLLMRIAAVFLLATAIFILYVHTNNTSRTLGKIAEDKTGEGLSNHLADTISSEELSEQKKDSNSIKDLRENITVLRNDTTFPSLAYQPSPVLENAIGNQVRGTAVIVKVPAISEYFMKGDTITFNWNILNHSQAWFVIKNNRGVTVFKENVSPPKRKQLNKPGLFYWQLRIDEDVVYTGKIVIKEKS
jgi:hypothetical protein